MYARCDSYTFLQHRSSRLHGFCQFYVCQMRQLYVSATSIIQMARLLPILSMPGAKVIHFCIIDCSDCKASANFYACEARRLYIFVTSSIQIVRLVSILGIPDATVIHFGSIDRSDREASVIFRHPRRDSYTLLQHRSLRV